MITVPNNKGHFLRSSGVWTRPVHNIVIGIIIIDIKLKSIHRIINVYRVFNPTGLVSQREYFTNQLRKIKNAVADARNRSCIILGDFNLNEEMKFRHDYSHKAYYDENLIINRMTCINRSIKYDWLNLSLIGYKLKVKELFLT